jgi:hypothetical protein
MKKQRIKRVKKEPYTFGGFFIDGKFHEIKQSWWRNLLARIQLRLSGWKFRYVDYEEFRRIIDKQIND